MSASGVLGPLSCSRTCVRSARQSPCGLAGRAFLNTLEFADYYIGGRILTEDVNQRKAGIICRNFDFKFRTDPELIKS